MRNLGRSLVALWFMAAGVNAIDFGINITIPDNDGSEVNKKGNPSTWYQKSHEDNEIEPWAISGQKYDLEGVFFDGSLLTMVGGYNFWNAPSGMAPGDLFIGLGDVLYGDDISQTQYDNGEFIRKNTFGYDYVFDLDFRNNAYSLYAINAASAVLKAIDNNGFGESNPWRYYDCGTLLGTGRISGQTLRDSDLTDYGIKGAWDSCNCYNDKHYTLQLDLSVLDLAPCTEFFTHFTMECGNDNLMGFGKTPCENVPDGGSTLALLLCAIISTRAMFRRTR